MKAAAVILLLTICGAASANLNQILRQSTGRCDITDVNDLAQLGSQCSGNIGTLADVCNNDDCGGALCNFYKTNGYPSICVTAAAQACRNAGASVPSACGAAALSAIKGLLVAVLLLATLIVA